MNEAEKDFRESIKEKTFGAHVVSPASVFVKPEVTRSVTLQLPTVYDRLMYLTKAKNWSECMVTLGYDRHTSAAGFKVRNCLVTTKRKDIAEKYGVPVEWICGKSEIPEKDDLPHSPQKEDDMRQYDLNINGVYYGSVISSMIEGLIPEYKYRVHISIKGA